MTLGDRLRSPGYGPEACSLKPEALRNRNLGADFFELLLDGLGLFLGHAFLDRLRRALDEVLRFLQAQAGDFADHLDDLDLVAAGFRQRDVELGLLLDGGRGRAAATCTRRRHGHRGRRAHAEFGFERLDELRELEDADALDVVDHLLLIQFGHCYLSPRPTLTVGLYHAGRCAPTLLM